LKRFLKKVYKSLITSLPVGRQGLGTDDTDINDLIVKAELPGMDPKDIDISLSDGTLIIKGERKQEKEEKEKDYHLIERSYGTFARMVRLPKEVKRDKISASYKDGILKVILPKSNQAMTKEVKIKVE
jgi:HSP20 family protein